MYNLYSVFPMYHSSLSISPDSENASYSFVMPVYHSSSQIEGE